MPNSGYAQVRRAFFDKSPAVRLLNRKTRRILSRFGAYVRTSARTSMRPDPKGGQQSSAPGKPPQSRGKKLLRDLLFFSYDEKSKSTVVGPLRLGRTASEHVPRTLEKGGTIVRDGKPNRYKARPFMKPAFEKNVGWVAAEYAKP